MINPVMINLGIILVQGFLCVERIYSDSPLYHQNSTYSAMKNPAMTDIH